MREILPAALGVLIGVIFLPRRRRATQIAFPAAVILTGVAASALNREIGGNWTALFLSFDMLQVAVAASLAPAAVWSWRRRTSFAVNRFTR